MITPKPTPETALRSAIAELLHVHAECLDRFGTDRPESNAMLGTDLIERMRRQRTKVDQSLDGPIEGHIAHVQALTAGMRVCMRKLETLE
jgi:hypothetical protein